MVLPSLQCCALTDEREQSEDHNTVGRYPDSDVFLDDVTVSRRHADFVREGTQFAIRDVGSLNGTLVNRERVEAAVLSSGDEVTIGKFRLVDVTGARSEEQPPDRHGQYGTGCQHGSMTNVRAERLVRRFYAEAWNAWDDTVVDELLAENFTFRGSLGDEVTGRDGWREYRDRVRMAAPDFHNEIVDLVVGRDSVAARLLYRGHHCGGLLGLPGRGQPFEYAGAAFFQSGHQLASAWVLGDLDSLRHQIAT